MSEARIKNKERGFELEVSQVVSGALGLGRLDGKVVFVPGALPGELHRVEVDRAKKGYAEARSLEILRPSPLRAEAECAHYGVCGGCDLMHADVRLQKEIKRSILFDALKRQGKVSGENLAEIESLTEFFSSPPWEYRNRFQFHAGPQQRPALRGRRSGTLVEIDDCPVAVGEIRAWLKGGPRLAGREGLSGQDDFDVFEPEPLSVGAGKSDGEPRYPVFARDGRVFLGDSEIDVKLGERNFLFSGRAFFQSNVSMLSALLGWLEPRLGEGGHAADLYGGVGVFAGALAQTYAKVSLVENNPAGVRYARRNLASLDVDIFEEKVEDWLSKLPEDSGAFDLILADPPRKGLCKALVDFLREKPVGRFVYVSCNPVSFARDFQALAGVYSLKALAVFDFYPQTWHMECVALFGPADPTGEGR